MLYIQWNVSQRPHYPAVPLLISPAVNQPIVVQLSAICGPRRYTGLTISLFNGSRKLPAHSQGIAMRKVFNTAILVAIASASAALASPNTADSSVPADAVSRPEIIATRPGTGEASRQPSLQAQSESKPDRGERQVLSKNFQRPKPVQIYWFFGGR